MLITLGLVAALSVCHAAPPAGVSWSDTFEAALKAARTSGKPVLAYFDSKYSRLCASTSSDCLEDATVIGLLSKFECVLVEAESQEDLVQRYHQYVYPVAVFTGSKGDAFYESRGAVPAGVMAARLRTALDLFGVQAELKNLLAKANDNRISGAKLARLGHILTVAGSDGPAVDVLRAALEKLPQTGAARQRAELEKLMAEANVGGGEARGALETWIAANPLHPWRWEAQYRLRRAQASARALSAAIDTLTEVSAKDEASDWGALSKYYAQLAEDELNPAQVAPGGG
jgi:hypothetical protein